MLFISILILIVAMALHSKYISSILFTRIASIVFIYAGALSLNALYIQSIGSGIGIYSGLFHVTTVSQLLDTFIFVIGSLILIAWPSISKSSLVNSISKSSLVNSISKSSLVNSIDYFILIIVIFALVGDLILLVSSIIHHLFDFFICFLFFVFCFLFLKEQSKKG